MTSNLQPWVLLVEDDVEIRETLESLLVLEGYIVQTAQHGKDALDVLQRNQVLPAIILLDLMMPVMNGYEFRERQLKSDRLCNIPTAVISADGNVIEKSARLRVSEFLKKPMDLSALFKLLERYCGTPAATPTQQIAL